MMDQTLTWPLFALILLCVLLESTMHLCFKRASDGVTLSTALLRPLLWLGILLWAVEIVLWIYVLGQVPLTLAFPIMSLVYVVTALGGTLLLKEKMNLRQIAGALLISIGVACVGVAQS